MKVSLTWVNDIEVKTFGDKVETNKYFASVCSYICGILGAWSAVAGFLNGVFSTEIETTGASFIPLLVILILMNVCESLLSCKTWGTSIARAFFILLCFALVYGIGVIAGMLVCILICIWMLINFIIMMLSGKSSGDTVLEDGTRLSTQSGFLGDKSGRDENGNYYEKNDDGTWSRK